MTAKSDVRATWRVMNLQLGLDEDEREVYERARALLGVPVDEVRGARLAHKALDARRRGGERALRFVCHVDVTVAGELGGREVRRALSAGRIRPAPERGALEREPGDGCPRSAVVVGAGPAGLFAALALARNGVRVRLFERGPRLEERHRPLVRFHRTGELDPEANLLFGEGGAGTYSDGKIYTRVDDPLEQPLLEELVACGAPPGICYDALAHIGTDRLHRILPAFRARLEALGVEFHFGARVDELLTDGAGQVRGLLVAGEQVACEALVLAVGHSARDTWAMLERAGVPFEPKPFQLGLRIEHPQELIDTGRYGGPDARLGAASYNLVARAAGDARAAHTFCMCPGGRIVASVSEPGLLCTNGMSNSKHSSGWATAAVVCTLGEDDYGPSAFAGVELQRELERRFFEAGGADYTAPAQTAADFLAGVEGRNVRRSTYPFGTRPARLDALLPPAVRDALRAALARFDRALPGFAGEQGLFVGLESRSSGPVRIPRAQPSLRTLGFANLYCVGEGAGWAGGIMSAALDGARAALDCVAAKGR